MIHLNIKAKFGACIVSIRASRIVSPKCKCKFRNRISNSKIMATKGLHFLSSESPEVYGGPRHYLGKY